MEQSRLTYALRNEPHRRFHIQAEAEGSGAGGCTVRALVTGPEGNTFRYEVVFTGEFARTKADFTEAMYLETGLAVVRSQIESHDHADQRIVFHRASGLPETVRL